MRYAMEGLSNQVLAAEYRTVFPDEAVLAAVLEQSQQTLADRALPSIDSELVRIIGVCRLPCEFTRQHRKGWLLVHHTIGSFRTSESCIELFT